MTNRLKLVHQRCGGDDPFFGDCGLAAFATVIGETYENLARELGVQIGPDGAAVFDRCVPLSSEFVAAAGARGLVLLPIDTKNGACMPAVDQLRDFLPTQEQLMTQLAGVPAVAIVSVECDGVMWPHDIVWDGARLVDLRSPEQQRFAPHDGRVLQFQVPLPMQQAASFLRTLYGRRTIEG